MRPNVNRKIASIYKNMKEIRMVKLLEWDSCRLLKLLYRIRWGLSIELCLTVLSPSGPRNVGVISIVPKSKWKRILTGEGLLRQATGTARVKMKKREEKRAQGGHPKRENLRNRQINSKQNKRSKMGLMMNSKGMPWQPSKILRIITCSRMSSSVS